MKPITRKSMSGIVASGRWTGCSVWVYPEEVGQAWHLEIIGVDSQTGKAVGWDDYADDDNSLVEALTAMGLRDLLTV